MSWVLYVQLVLATMWVTLMVDYVLARTSERRYAHALAMVKAVRDAGSELERTRRYEVSDFPAGTRMLMGDRRDLDDAIARGGLRAVGKFTKGANGVTTVPVVPVVYVSKRAQPFVVRHKVALLVTGGLLLLAAGIAWIIMAVGLGWFLGGLGLGALAIALLARISRGGGRSANVEVTTTTTVRVKR